MQSHRDSDTSPLSRFQQDFLKTLGDRADRLSKAGKSKIAGGVDGEPVLAEWSHDNIFVRQMPDDEQKILRISVGGGDHLPATLNYLTFRGPRGECIDLLRRALKALETDPK